MTNQRHPNSHLRRRLGLAAIATTLAVGGLLLAGAGADDPHPASAGSGHIGADRLPEGTSQARLLSASEDGVLLLDPLELLSGEEALRAAVAAGEFVEGDGLPNDVYLHDPDHRSVEGATSSATTVWLYDCWSTCELAEVPIVDVIANRITYYGGATPVVEVTVDDGIVTHISELYLP